MRYRLILSFLSCFFISSFTYAIQYGIFDIEYFNRREYKAGTQNWSVSQAENGLLYFANNEGVIEYDGSNWRSLPNATNTIVRTVMAHNKRIYMGANEEFGYYETDSLSDFHYVSLKKKFNLENVGDFWSIFHHDNQIIFQSENALYLFSQSEEMKVIEAHSRIPLAFSVNGLFLVHDDLLGLMELRQEKLFRVTGGEIFSEIQPTAMIPLSDDEIIIGTINHGLIKWSVKGFEKWDVPASDFLETVNIFCGTSIDNDLIFGSIQSGVVIADTSGHIKMVAGKDQGLNNNTVLGIFIDKQKNIWSGLDNGISKIEYNSAVSFIQGYYDIGTGYCMEQHNQNVYMGTNQGLYYINKEKFRNPLKNRSDFQKIDNTNGQVWTIFSEPHTQTLLCGHNYGIFVINENKAVKITPPEINGAWIFKPVPNKPNLIIAGTYRGLTLLKHSPLKGWEFITKIEGFDESSRFMEWDTDGALWVAHGIVGIFKLYFNSDYTEIVKMESFSDFKGLDDISNFTFAKINQELLMVSNHGIYSATNHDTFNHNPIEFYFNDYEHFPSQIKQDPDGNIWFFIDERVGVLRLQEDGTYKHISNPLLAMKNKLVNGFESIYFWDSETTFFGVEDGFGQYSISSDINYYQPFEIHIRPFKNQNDSYTNFYTNSFNPASTQKIIPKYPYQHNNFDVSYSATWFGNGNLEYTTWVEGYENNWQPWSETSKRQFTYLPEGDYTFKVKARNIYGVESLPASFKFSVAPPWHRSTLANTIYIILALSTMILFWFITSNLVRNAALKEKKRQKENFKEREEKLKHEALVNEKEMIRLRNEKLRNDMLYKEKELANSTMHIIHKNDFLKNIKTELLKIKKDNAQTTIDKKITSIIRNIEKDIHNESHWKVFETHLEQVHEAFLKRLNENHKKLSPRELKLAAYLRMNMSSKEIATLMNVTPRAVENNRSKLRKKLNLEQGHNLVDYVMNI